MTRLRGFQSLSWALLVQTVRNKAALFWNLVLPLFFMIGLSYVFGGGEPRRVTHIVPGILTINLLAASFFGVSFHMVSMREQEVYRRFLVTPVSSFTVVMAHAVTALVNITVATILQLAVALLLFHIEIRGSVLELAIAVLLAAFAMIPLGLLVGSVAQDMKTAPVIANMVFFVMMFVSGAAMPLYLMPAWLQRVATLLPATYVVEVLQAAILRGDMFAGLAVPTGILIVTGIIGFAFNALLFRWESQEPINLRALAVTFACLAVVYGTAFAVNVKLKSVRDPESLVDGAPDSSSPPVPNPAEEPPPNVTPALPSGRRVLAGMTILDGSGQRIERGRVVIDGDRIVEVGSAEFDSSDDATDLSGLYMIPGLIDSHMHLGGSAGGSVSSTEYAPNRLVHDLQVYLAMGVTSFVSMTDDIDDMKSLRSAVAAGTMRSPRPFYCGPSLTAPDGHPARFFVIPGLAERMTRQVDSPEAAKAAVRDLAEMKIDVVKLYLDSGRIGESYPVLGEATFRAAIAAAQELQLRTTVHVDSDLHARLAIDAGADGLEHIPPDLSDETIAALVEKGITLTPTLSAAEGMKNAAIGARRDDPLVIKWVDPEIITSLQSHNSWIDRIRSSPAAVAYYIQRYERSLAAVRRAVAAGVTIVAGSDAGNPASFHGIGLLRELELLVDEGGMTPADAIVAATGTAAERLGMKESGTISPGAFADFVLLGSDPEQNIRALRNIHAVYFAGRSVERDTILTTSPGDWMPQSGVEAR